MGYEMAAIILTDIIRTRKGKPLFIIFTDVKSAFDRVKKDALWWKLVMKIPSPNVKILKALYSSTIKRVRAGENISEAINCTLGLAQGSPA